MRVLIALSLVVVSCLAETTTHRPHHTKEPTEHETVSFHYAPKTHNLIIRLVSDHNLNCYVATLTVQQQHDVHTDNGIRALELKLLSQVSTATQVESASLDAGDLHSCGHAPHNGTVAYYTM